MNTAVITEFVTQVHQTMPSLRIMAGIVTFGTILSAFSIFRKS